MKTQARTKQAPNPRRKFRRAEPSRLQPTGRKLKLAQKLDLRARLGFSREEFARMTSTSVRSLATVEAGGRLSPTIQRRLTELSRVVEALQRVIQPEGIGDWLQTPNSAFGELKPLEVIERGEIDRLWQMIYLLESGSPV